METDEGQVSLETFRQELMLQMWERISPPSDEKKKTTQFFAH